jgi:hypothetical protein
MTPKNNAVEPDVLEALKQRADAEGMTVDEAANEAILLERDVTRIDILLRLGRTL